MLPLIRGRDNALMKHSSVCGTMAYPFNVLARAHHKVQHLKNDCFILLDMKATCEDALNLVNYAIFNKDEHNEEIQEQNTHVLNDLLSKNIMALLSEINAEDRIRLISKAPYLCLEVTTYEEFKACTEDFLQCINVIMDINLFIISNTR